MADQWENGHLILNMGYFFSCKSVFLKVWHAWMIYENTDRWTPHPVCQFTGLGGGTIIWISNKFPGDPAGPGCTLEYDSLRSYPLKSKTKAHEGDRQFQTFCETMTMLSHSTDQYGKPGYATSLKKAFSSSLKSKTNKLTKPRSQDGGFQLRMNVS